MPNDDPQVRETRDGSRLHELHGRQGRQQVVRGEEQGGSGAGSGEAEETTRGQGSEVAALVAGRLPLNYCQLPVIYLPHDGRCEMVDGRCFGNYGAIRKNPFWFGDVTYHVVLPSCAATTGRIADVIEGIERATGCIIIERRDMVDWVRDRNPSLFPRLDSHLPGERAALIHRNNRAAYYWWRPLARALPPRERCERCGVPSNKWAVEFRRFGRCSDDCSAHAKALREERAATSIAAMHRRQNRRLAIVADEARRMLQSERVARRAQVDQLRDRGPDPVLTEIRRYAGCFERYHDHAWSCVYFLVKRDRIVYVGQTTNLPSRVASHRLNLGTKFDKVFHRNVPRDDLDRVESALIRALRPALNRGLPSRSPKGESDPDLLVRFLGRSFADLVCAHGTDQ